MSKTKLSTQIDKFSKLAVIISPLCSKYNSNVVKPFVDSAQIYNENFRSSTEFYNLLHANKQFFIGSISICYRLFNNYEPSKQAALYEWSRKLFNLLNSAKKIIDDAYELAYTVGRTDTVTRSIIEKETNPLVTIRRKVIIEDYDYDAYKKTMVNWKCNIQTVYVEEQYMKHVVDVCNSRKSKFNPVEAKVNTCTLRRTITIPDNDYEATPQVCMLNAEVLAAKTKIEMHDKNNSLTVDDIDNYISLYNKYRHELISFTFGNFIQLYNETCVQCLRIFLEQQHSIVFNLLQRRKTIVQAEMLKYNETQRIDNINWTDINKDTLSTTKQCSDTVCTNPMKVVGSLE